MHTHMKTVHLYSTHRRLIAFMGLNIKLVVVGNSDVYNEKERETVT